MWARGWNDLYCVGWDVKPYSLTDEDITGYQWLLMPTVAYTVLFSLVLSLCEHDNALHLAAWNEI